MSPYIPNSVNRGRALPDQIGEVLRAQIASGAFRPGQRLPTEKELCETYGVSRPIIREAIGRLKSEGLITSRQGLGAFVAEGGASNVFRLDIGHLEDSVELEHIIELLVAVEVAVAEKAAQRRTSAQLANLKRALQAIDVSIAAGKDGVEEDMLFHRSVAEACGNPFFRELNDFLEVRARKFIRTARTNTARLGMPRVVQMEHAAIYDAIRRRDAEAARSAAESHLRHAAERLALYRR